MYKYISDWMSDLIISWFGELMADGGPLKTDMFKDIRKLINIIDELRDYGLDK